MLTLTREQVRRVDQIAIEQFHMPGIALMENAGRGATEFICQLIGEVEGKRCIIFCGGGNNGGDGYVIARHLHNLGAEVHIVQLKPIDKLGGDARINADIAAAMQLSTTLIASTDDLPLLDDVLADADLLVDALLGTGFSGDVREPMASVIAKVNERRVAGSKTVAIDLPSGMDCDTGQPTNATVEADMTTTFVAVKQGFTKPGAEALTGDVKVVDIGAPKRAIELAMQPS